MGNGAAGGPAGGPISFGVPAAAAAGGGGLGAGFSLAQAPAAAAPAFQLGGGKATWERGFSLNMSTHAWSVWTSWMSRKECLYMTCITVLCHVLTVKEHSFVSGSTQVH